MEPHRQGDLDEKLSRAQSVATLDGFGGINISDTAKVSETRDLWSDTTDSKSDRLPTPDT